MILYLQIETRIISHKTQPNTVTKCCQSDDSIWSIQNSGLISGSGLFVDFVVDVWESLFALIPLSHLIVECVVKHGPELFLRHVGVRIHHLVSLHVSDKFFNLSCSLDGIESLAFWRTIDTNINKQLIISTWCLEHARATGQL